MHLSWGKLVDVRFMVWWYTWFMHIMWYTQVCWVCAWACVAHVAMQCTDQESYASSLYFCWPEFRNQINTLLILDMLTREPGELEIGKVWRVPSWISSRVVKLILPCYLISLFLAFIPQSFVHDFICLARTLVLILLCGLRASSSEVGRTSTNETTVRLTRTTVLFAS